MTSMNLGYPIVSKSRPMICRRVGGTEVAIGGSVGATAWNERGVCVERSCEILRGRSWSKRGNVAR